MAAFLFTRAILAGEPIKVFNEGRMARDFTYIDDIVAGTIAAHDRPPGPGVAPDLPISESTISREVARFHRGPRAGAGRGRDKELLPMQPGDVPESFADIERRAAISVSSRKTTIEIGLACFVEWYKQYHTLS